MIDDKQDSAAVDEAGTVKSYTDEAPRTIEFDLNALPILTSEDEEFLRQFYPIGRPTTTKPVKKKKKRGGRR